MTLDWVDGEGPDLSGTIMTVKDVNPPWVLEAKRPRVGDAPWMELAGTGICSIGIQGFLMTFDESWHLDIHTVHGKHGY